LYLVFADRDYAGPGALRLAQIIRDKVSEQCRRLEAEPPETAALDADPKVSRARPTRS
jgi:hypothetical protein